MAMMWAGRFSKEVDSKVNAFNSSFAFKSINGFHVLIFINRGK